MKKVIRCFLALTTIMVLLLSLIGCGATPPAEDSEPNNSSSTEPSTTPPSGEGTPSAEEQADPWVGKRVGVVHISMYDEWCQGVYSEFIKQGEELGFAEVNVQNGDGKPELQQTLVENFIAQQYDIILVDPSSPAGIVPSLEKAGQQDIPIIAFDSYSEYDEQISWIAQDHGEIGAMSARYVADYARENLGGKLRVGLLQSLSAPHVKVRGDRFLETIEEELGAENITYVFDQDYGGTREAAANIISNNIAKPVDVIWTAVDTAMYGARVTLETNQIEDTVIVCADAWGVEFFSLLYQGDPYIKMGIGVPPPELVRLSLETVCEVFEGKTDIPDFKPVPVEPIDASNISEYVQFVPEDNLAELTKGPNVA